MNLAKLAEYEMNIHTSLTFLYINNINLKKK